MNWSRDRWKELGIDHEWTRIFANGERRKVVRGLVCGMGDFEEIDDC